MGAPLVNAAGAQPVIDSFSPEQGKENDIMVINGKNFGDRNVFVNPNRYVNFNGFLGTEILQWSDSVIEIKIPRLGAVANEQKETAVDVVSAIPIVRSYAKLPLKLLPIRVAKSPEEAGTRATVKVVAPDGESNAVYFFYQHEVSSEKVNYVWDTAKLIGRTFFDEYIKKPFNTILHPIQTLQNKTERITRTINNSIVLPLDDFGKTDTTKKDNCDFSHYIIEYNEPQPMIEIARDKITSLNIGIFSAINDRGKTIISIRGNEKDGPLTKAELDKLNKGLAELGIFKPLLFNSLETINGVCGRPNEPLIITKEDMEKLWENKREKEGMTTTPNAQTPQQPQAQQSKIAALVVSPNGEPVYQAKFWLVDSQGRLVDKSAGGIAYDSVRYTTQTGRLETITVPDGQYALNVACAANCMFGDKFAQSVANDIYAKWSKTLQVEVKGSDIWLDKITLIREK